ncbi:unnamed protein product [Agarophyton chilense]|eukprot:gb/GEZJ01002828.1/.p1 GENE.gb/GEZJ01002828.1/~~gb/GEZJ01002828.1/.p1  ORF type:complete len:333 (-),score=28.97 gb/GEZJ01002828.1/:1119-2117(-)
MRVGCDPFASCEEIMSHLPNFSYVPNAFGEGRVEQRPADSSSSSRGDRVELAPGDYSGKLPVDIVNMPVVPCPLIKLGNRVIICGRYSDEQPCVKAANNLGVTMLSKTFSGRTPPHTMCREDRFLADWKAFHHEIYGLVPKLPTVSGSKLDLFLFAQQILLLGGIDTVVEKRGFVVLAKQLRLSKPCTSAATVLRRAHQSLMHQYEQKLLQIMSKPATEPYAVMSSRKEATTWDAWHGEERGPPGSPRRKVRRLSEPHAYTTSLQSAHRLECRARLSAVEPPPLLPHAWRDNFEALPRLPPLRMLTSGLTRRANAAAKRKQGGGSGHLDDAR